MDQEVSSLFKCLLLLWMLIAVVGLPTLGYVVRNLVYPEGNTRGGSTMEPRKPWRDRTRLETYEDQSAESSDLDLFGNLTFRFSCEGKSIGLYADADYGCRVFHACDDSGQGFPVICPNYTLFDQRERVCSDEGHVDCAHANEWFYLNDLPYSEEVTEENDTKQDEEEQVPSVLPLVLS